MSERGNVLMRSLDRWIGVPLVYVIGALHHKKSPPTEVKTIGILAFGPIGDFLLSVGSAVPAIRSAIPNCAITVFITTGNKAAIPLVTGVDDYVELPIKNLVTSVRLIRQRSFDVLIDFGPWPRISALLAALSGARFSIGFRTAGQFRHYALDADVLHRNDRHEIENYAAILNCLGIHQTLRPIVEIKQTATAKVTEMRLGRYLVFHPWASGFRKQMREWPDEFWRALATEFLDLGYTIVFTGGPSDKLDSSRLVAGSDFDKSKIHDLAGQLSLSETAALLNGAMACVTVNTGIMHLAAILDTPLVALHGPTNPKRWGPLSNRAVVLLPNTPNAAYLNLGFEYPDQTEPCMQLISVEEVAVTLRNVLKDNGRQQYTS